MYVREKFSLYIFIVQTYNYFVYISCVSILYFITNITTDKFVLLQQMLLLINLVSWTVSNRRREKSWGKQIGDVGAAGKVGVGRGVKGYRAT